MARKKNEPSPVIRFAPIGELRFYTVTEEELEALGRGSLGSVYLNLTLALLPVSVAFLLTLLSTEIKNTAVLFAFVSGSVVCFVVGVIFAVLAYVHHTSTSQIVKKIKERMPPPASVEPEEPSPPQPPTTP